MSYAIGIDVGGTKIAAGLVRLPEGTVSARRMQPTGSTRDGEAVLADVIALARSLLTEAQQTGLRPTSLGVGVAELVSPSGDVLSDATIRWKGLAVQDRLNDILPARIEADVRAAALGESRAGAGAGLDSFLYVTVGTGISSCLVVKGQPFTGARGLTGTCASARGLIPGDDGQLHEGPPLEQFASGPALAGSYRLLKPGSAVEAPEVVALACSGDALAARVVDSAGRALGAEIAHLVNVLDPEAVIIGGGLGLAGGPYRAALETGFRAHLWSPIHASVPILPAKLGADAGLVGAAFASQIN